MGYLHSKEYEIKYTDVDVHDRIKLSSLLSVLEESACLSADELKFGYADITPKNVAFIISNWYVSFKGEIKLGDVVRVETWPLRPSKIICLRDFRIWVADRLVAVATSRWCLVDRSTFRILPARVVFDDDTREYNEDRSTDFTRWKWPTQERTATTYEKVVSYSDYDHYSHVNNTKYADFMVDAMPSELVPHISSFVLTYVKQCKSGERLSFCCRRDGDRMWVDGYCGDELRMQAEIELN